MKLKKLIAAVLASAAVLSSFGAVGASAANIGDVVNHVLYTDIVTYIDGKPIESFNIDGYTAIVVEDLLNYGFNVVYDNSTRSLSVTKGSGVITSTYKPTANTHPIGSVAMDVLYTDIVTYIEGKKVESYNIQGRTICYVDDLALAYASNYVYDNDSRTLSMTVGSTKPAAPAKNETTLYFEGKPANIKVANVAFNDYGKLIVYLGGDGITGEIPIRDNKMIAQYQANIVVGKAEYHWENLRIVYATDDSTVTQYAYTFSVSKMPDKVVLYSFDDEQVRHVYDVKLGEFVS